MAAAELEAAVLIQIEGMEGPIEARFQVAQQNVDPTKLRQIIGMLTTADNNFMTAVRRVYRAQASQAIGEHRLSCRQELAGPLGDDRCTEA